MTRPVLHALTLTFLVAIAFGCNKKTSKNNEGASTDPGAVETSPTAAKKAKKVKKPTPTEATAATVRQETTALLAGWTEAQNKGDFASYKTSYQPHFFRGVKRTSSGKVVRLDYKGWLADRGRMFKKPVVVATEDVEIKTWLDPGSKLKPQVTAIRFLQRWKSGSYADHGIKLVHLWRDASGRQRIVYEDLVNAEPDWNDEVKNVETITVEAPKTDQEALAVWKSLGVTGANHGEKLAALPDDEVVTGALARALIAGGNFDCKDINAYDECGEEYKEWAPLDPKSTFDHPCLRRRLAEWAMDEISDKDAEELEAQLAAIAAVVGPSDDLVEAALEKAFGTSTEVALEVALAAVKAGHDEAVDAAVSNADETLLIALYRAGVTAGGEKLADKLDMDGPHFKILLEIVNDEKIEIETRSGLISDLESSSKKGVNEALHAAAKSKDCGLAISAAEALAERGDKSALPSRSSAAGAEETLCRLLAGSSDYAAAEAAKFFPENGIAFTETIEGDDYPEYDDDGNEVEEEKEEEEEAEADPEMIDQGTFEALDPFNDDEVTFSFGEGKDGKPVVESVDKHSWSGCGC